MAASGRSDVEVLSRSFRSRILLLVLLLALGLSAALWSGTRKAGKGAPEDRRRIMVVTGGGSIDDFEVLERAGFEIEIESLEEWVAQARATAPDSEAEGVALLLELADQRGAALLLIEQPSEGDLARDLARDLAALELEPALDSIEDLAERNYLVLSVGDYGFPHRLSVSDPGPHPLIRLPGYGALQAVFRQELIGARELQDRPTIEELEYEGALRSGRRMFEKPQEFDAQLAAERLALAEALADGSGARTMLPPLATGSPIPTPEGGLVLVHHELVFYSDDARSLKLEVSAQMQISWVAPAALGAGLGAGLDAAGFVLEPCPSLAGGALSMAEKPRIETAADGSAVAIGSASGGATLWRKVPTPGCDWEPVAELARHELEGIELAPRLTGGDRILAARAQLDDRGAQLLVWALPDGDGDGDGDGEGYEGEGEGELGQVIFEQDDRRFHSLAFLDDRHLALLSELFSDRYTELAADADNREDRLYLLDRARPGVYLSVPIEPFAAPGSTLRELVALAPAQEAAGPELLLLVQDPSGPMSVVRLRIRVEAWEAFTRAPVEALDEFEFGGQDQMVSLTPEQLEATVVTTLDHLSGLRVSSGGRVLYSFDSGSGSAELALLDLDTGVSQQLTRNEVRDSLPRLTADGRAVTFVSSMRVGLSPTPFSVPRVLALPPRTTK